MNPKISSQVSLQVQVYFNSTPLVFMNSFITCLLWCQRSGTSFTEAMIPYIPTFLPRSTTCRNDQPSPLNDEANVTLISINQHPLSCHMVTFCLELTQKEKPAVDWGNFCSPWWCDKKWKAEVWVWNLLFKIYFFILLSFLLSFLRCFISLCLIQWTSILPSPPAYYELVSVYQEEYLTMTFLCSYLNTWPV